MKNHKQVRIEEYNPEWPKAYKMIESVILEKLDGLLLRIEHVGSTSIPNLAAKPIIDIDIVIESMDYLPRVTEELEQLGYIHEGNLGIAGREAFARRDDQVPYSRDVRVKHEHHLYVCDKESQELQRHIMFRDILRKQPLLVSEYAKLKMELSQKFKNDRSAYTDGKTEFITEVMKVYKDALYLNVWNST